MTADSGKTALYHPAVIVGAGASGLYCAAHVHSRQLLLLEKMGKPGQKLLLTGGGRCNLTHEFTAAEMLEHYRDQKSARFLHGSMQTHGPRAVRRFFHESGVPTAVDDKGRVHPASDDAADVLNALLDRISHAGHEIWTGISLEGLEFSEAAEGRGRWVLTLNDGQIIRSDQVVLAGGGASYPHSGSDGSILDLLKKLGVRTEDYRPALTDLRWKRPQEAQDFADLSGLTLQDVVLALPGKKQPAIRGALLFTHRGISGPASLNISRELSAAGSPLVLNLLPDSNPEALYQNFILLTRKMSSRQLAALLDTVLPSRLSRALVQRQWPELEGCRLDQISQKHFRKIAADICALELPALRTGPLRSGMVSRGGVQTRMLEPKTMEIRGFPGLYVIGELIGLDGETGGYNLQMAFSTAYAAARVLDGEASD